MGLAPSVVVGDSNFVIAIISLFVCFMVGFVFAPYCLWVFYKDRNELYAQKRRPALVIGLIVTNVFIQICLVFTSLYMLRSMFYDHLH